MGHKEGANGNAYLTHDKTHWDGSACHGRGEVMIRGPSVSLGYYAAGDDEEEVKGLIKKTEEEFGHTAPNQGNEYHWFHTGDIGLFTPDGRLKLIDRKKNLVKLKGGEYVAIEQMESVYSGSTFVNGIAGGIMCHGDGDLDKPVALVQAEMNNIKTWAKDNDIKTQDPDELCKDKAVIKMVLDDLNEIGKGKVAANERLADIALISGTGPAEFPGSNTSAWTPENGFLTASNKIDRNNIKNGTCRNGEPSKDQSPWFDQTVKSHASQCFSIGVVGWFACKECVHKACCLFAIHTISWQTKLAEQVIASIQLRVMRVPISAM